MKCLLFIIEYVAMFTRISRRDFEELATEIQRLTTQTRTGSLDVFVRVCVCACVRVCACAYIYAP